MGLPTALGEITLVLFTTLAPSGAFAICALALLLMLAPMSPVQRRRLDKFMYIPLIATMAGLVASATHLGNPSNALFTFMGVGKSPLSNEVFAAVCFLLLTGVYWLLSFRPLRSRAIRNVWLAAILAAGVVFVFTVAFAYDVESIVTWNTPLVPVALVANACVGGPMLAATTLRISKWGQHGPACGEDGSKAAQDGRGKAGGGTWGAGTIYSVLTWISVAGLAASTIAYIVQGVAFDSKWNYVTNAWALVPGYWWMLAAYVVFCGVAVVAESRWRSAAPASNRRKADADREGSHGNGKAAAEQASNPSGHRRIAGNRPQASDVFALTCAFCGIFVMRFAFYMMHMTAGMGV